MTINFDGLKKEIPYKWRLNFTSKDKTNGTCVAYIDARDVMDILDNEVGPDKWQDKYELQGKTVVCSIGFRDDLQNEWVWKTDAGSVKDNDRDGTIKDKGDYSDAFKRAAVKWGIGRFLYDLEIERVKLDGQERPNVIDDHGKRIYDLTKFINES